MSWTDKVAVENIKQLQKDFNIKVAIETGTFKGVNAELYSSIFHITFTCELNTNYYNQASERLNHCYNVFPTHLSSPEFLRRFAQNESIKFVYLDAHFYDPESKVKWVVIEELKALQGHNDIVLCIHDFDNGMGHLIYDGEHLDWKLIGEYLQKINPDFHYYTNTEAWAYTEETIKELPITVDEVVLDAIKFVHSTEARKIRGMLFATPKPLDLSKYQLREFKCLQ